ncbi:glycosyltransferase family 1 protein [Streptomyces spinosirectus]|jgi:phosphatidylinositol alpha 1,6-mannosyltransferase|uniref:glycosyltransferase family 4 protein n=1 Tax=Streptomyces TaxID=1883 RepID=UPI000D390ED2|nr:MULTISPECIES: glycosyltransferase family 1 protein [Streptomyces]MBY8342186.1 glycosyltransferase family 1 protein [Streptomyces plumbidurans]PTM94500.1 phosphatidylinositol alpha 1,6-mannosyltransferase [Streptomyces sp. VMFN-G11Ma]UIR16798.1 glycosyltransferase family 1 protein [Streptomyces spinosirectus]
MRVVIVTESFPPDVNGVAHCALQTARHLADRGHLPLVVAPASTALVGRAGTGPDAQAPCPVVRVPSLPLPGYPQVRVALPSRRLAAAVAGHRPDVVHLASPFVLGVRGMAVAARCGVPAVAVYQTDLAGYARTYMGAGEATAWRRIRSVHAAADLTLAPSSASLRDLEAHDVPRVKLWPRGVDTARFRPELRDGSLRRELAPNGELIVGYVGRLAPEKHIELLAGVCGLDGVKVVVVGDGPSRPSLSEALPGAVFLGRRTGDDLARIYASLDLFAHTGPFETFCQTVQEAMASGLPVVAPAVGGPLDLVAHGRTGLLVPPRDADAVREAVRSLMADPARRAAFGATARATVEGRTWAAVGDQLIGHYADVLAARRKTAVAA